MGQEVCWFLLIVVLEFHQAQQTCKDFNSSTTPLGSTWIGSITGITGSSIGGGVSNEIGVNTDVKYLLRISASSVLLL